MSAKTIVDRVTKLFSDAEKLVRPDGTLDLSRAETLLNDARKVQQELELSALSRRKIRSLQRLTLLPEAIRLAYESLPSELDFGAILEKISSGQPVDLPNIVPSVSFPSFPEVSATKPTTTPTTAPTAPPTITVPPEQAPPPTLPTPQAQPTPTPLPTPQPTPTPEIPTFATDIAKQLDLEIFNLRIWLNSNQPACKIGNEEICKQVYERQELESMLTLIRTKLLRNFYSTSQQLNADIELARANAKAKGIERYNAITRTSLQGINIIWSQSQFCKSNVTMITVKGTVTVTKGNRFGLRVNVSVINNRTLSLINKGLPETDANGNFTTTIVLGIYSQRLVSAPISVQVVAGDFAEARNVGLERCAP